MKERQVLPLLWASTMLLATGCDEEAIKTAVLENLESALLTGSETDDEDTDQSMNDGNTKIAGNYGSTDVAKADTVTTEPVKSKRTNVYPSITHCDAGRDRRGRRLCPGYG